MVLGDFSFDYRLDLVTIQGSLTGDRYIHEVLDPVVIDHFDDQRLATRPLFMDDNARPHLSRAVNSHDRSHMHVKPATHLLHTQKFQPTTRLGYLRIVTDFIVTFWHF